MCLGLGWRPIEIWEFAIEYWALLQSIAIGIDSHFDIYIGIYIKLPLGQHKYCFQINCCESNVCHRTYWICHLLYLVIYCSLWKWADTTWTNCNVPGKPGFNAMKWREHVAWRWNNSSSLSVGFMSLSLSWSNLNINSLIPIFEIRAFKMLRK